MRTLHEKITELPPGAFPFATEFGRLRDEIAPQIGDTRILFPEFTPHDEALHVVKLFQIADKLFGGAYNRVNAAELFILACALYAHDWGMAIGGKEHTYLRNGAKECNLDKSFTPLPDETERLKTFVRLEGLLLTDDGELPEIDVEHLRLYARQTHARRSAARVRAHFKESPAVGDAIGHLCEGHWHEFATLDDPQQFPREYQVADQSTCLLAIALQLRLIDLFHITDDRTPYALWRFVSPRDSRSATEWNKHRALNAMSVVEFQPGRAIKLQGFTEDEEVWAGLQDLRRYCEEQLAKTWDLSARNVPERYQLNFVKLEWNVTTGMLRPVSLSFCFDNKAMFQILSDDIYDGDPYVFLRELLQNAIDAIRTRRQRHEQRAQSNTARRRADVTFDTTIYFTVKHAPSGDIYVSCRDYGIGMDEHVIRNYFTVAGVSYYRSDEFQRQHLGFEPISRFGIGILSCFMVSDSLDVKTYRDPECGPAMTFLDAQLPGADAHRPRKLHLRVPSVERQFIVKDLAAEFDVGTEVFLHVSRQKLQQRKAKESFEELERLEEEGEADDFSRALNVTEYFCGIAGFVEFPIYIEESVPSESTPRRTLVLHPDRSAEAERAHFSNEVVVHQLQRQYPWDDVISAEGLLVAQEVMSEHRFEMTTLLKGRGYEGWVTFPIVKDEYDFDLRESQFDETRYIKVRKHGDVEWLESDICWIASRYHLPKRLFGIYRDGICLTKITDSDELTDRESLATPHVLINLSSSETGHTNVARSMLATQQAWDAPVWEAIKNDLNESGIKTAINRLPKERDYQFGRLAATYGLTEKEFCDLTPKSKKVSVWLTSPGVLQLREGELSPNEEIPAVPHVLADHVYVLAAKLWGMPIENDVGIVWEGPNSILGELGYSPGFFQKSFSAPLRKGLHLAAEVANLVAVRKQFLQPPLGSERLIEQSVCVTMPNYEDVCPRHLLPLKLRAQRDRRVNKSLSMAIEHPLSLQPIQICDIALAHDYLSHSPVPFIAPFQDRFGTVDGRFNTLHLAGREVLRALAACLLASRKHYAPPQVYSALREMLVRLYWRTNMSGIQRIPVLEFVSELFGLVTRYNLIDGFKAPSMPSLNDLIPNVSGTASADQEPD
ncbi:MAG: hypothetical protein WD468_04570, partial [Pirellulales bacterium]